MSHRVPGSSMPGAAADSPVPSGPSAAAGAPSFGVASSSTVSASRAARGTAPAARSSSRRPGRSSSIRASPRASRRWTVPPWGTPRRGAKASGPSTGSGSRSTIVTRALCGARAAAASSPAMLPPITIECSRVVMGCLLRDGAAACRRPSLHPRPGERGEANPCDLCGVPCGHPGPWATELVGRPRGARRPRRPPGAGGAVEPVPAAGASAGAVTGGANRPGAVRPGGRRRRRG